MTTAQTEQTSLELPDAMTQRVTVLRATRENLIAESKANLELRHQHFKTLHGDRRPGDPVPERTPLTDAAFDACTGLVGAGTYAYLIAAMLREVDEKDPALALELAEMVDQVGENGIEWIEDANGDLDGDEETAATR